MRIVARVNADPSSAIHESFLRYFEEIRARFLAALGLAHPDLSETEIERRFHYALAAMLHTFCWGKYIDCLCSDPGTHRERVLSSLIEYAAGGLRAPRGTADLAELEDLIAAPAEALS